MVNKEEIFAKFVESLNMVTAGDLHEEVTGEKSFENDLGIDSLTMVEIAIVVEQKLGVKIPDDELGDLETVRDAVDYLAERTSTAGAKG